MSLPNALARVYRVIGCQSDAPFGGLGAVDLMRRLVK
jgi:hypothetical protein